VHISTLKPGIENPGLLPGHKLTGN